MASVSSMNMEIVKMEYLKEYDTTLKPKIPENLNL